MSRWPSDVFPKGTIRNTGQSGAILSDVKRIIGTKEFQSVAEETVEPCCFVVCAGENDIGSGVCTQTSEMEMKLILETLLLLHPQHRVIVLGPKFEPWLANDKAARKTYLELSMMQERCCADYPRAHFVDGLTLFCSEDSASIPGARFAGRAQPETDYFDVDGLHLSRKGYVVWKEIVDDIVSRTL